MSAEDNHLHSFFQKLSLSEAKEHLVRYSVEELRQLWERGAFGRPLSAELKSYIVTRITTGNLDHDRPEEGG
jgi:hypothetical protein